ncbi:DNA polymerase I [Pseudoclavibacter endophyticus]
MVIDGHSLAYRAFFALPVDSFVTNDGQHTNGIHGFISMLVLLLQNEQPTHLAVAFDISRHSFRTREYADYKSTRDVTPPEFKGQVPLLQDALRAMGIPTLTKEDYEADDILATLARKGREEGFNVLLVSGDRDTIQLVNDEVTLLYPSTQGVSQLKRYTPDAVVERYAVRPEQYPDVAALVGEKSDNLPGIPKVGEKTAAKWLAKWGSLQGILDHQDEITGKVGESFREHQQEAVRNRKLNRLVDDIDLPVEPGDLARGPMNTTAIREVFTRLQFRTLQERILALAESNGAETSAPPQAAAPVRAELLDEELERWLETAVAASPEGLALTVRTLEGIVTEVGISGPDEATFLTWIPGRADYAPFESWLASGAPKIMFDAKAQLKALLRAGLAVGGAIVDGQIASWLARPQNPPKRLAEFVQQQLDEALPEGDPNELVPPEDAVSFAASDAWFVRRATLEALARLDPGSRGVFDDIEAPLLTVLARMELDGVAVDRSFLQALIDEQRAKVEGLRTAALEAAGVESVNLGSPKQLQEVLFDRLGMPKTRKTKTGYSTDADALAELERSNPHPFLGALRLYRDTTKLLQIEETLMRAIIVGEAPGSDRIHTTYVQVGSASGRLSSNDPNLQNIPIRSSEGRRVRQAFTHGGEFETLLTADYSQIEMRIMAHLSGDEQLIAAFNAGEDLHRFVGARVFHVDPADVTPEMRSKVKAMSYGLAYGLSAFGLSKQLQIEVAEAKGLMEDYFTRFGKVRDYLRGVVEQATENGYTETIFGRRRPFPDLKSTNRLARENAQRAALNSPIQGSAADIIKRAMIAIDTRVRAAGLSSRMLLQVHDELVFEVAFGETEVLEALVRTEMSGAAELAMPLDVQVGIGPNWDAAAH